MESIMVYGIGAAALSYLGYVGWTAMTGKSGCNCSESATCSQQDKTFCCNQRK